MPIASQTILGNIADESGGGGGAPAGLVFASEWDTATGTSSAAIQDTGRTNDWSVLNTSSAFEVLSTSGESRDYPTSNFLRVTNQSGQMVLAFQGSDSYYSAPSVGQSVYARFYFRMLQSGTSGDSHGTYFDDNWAGGTNWGPAALGMYIGEVTSTDFAPLISAASGQDPRYFGPTGATNLAKNTTYRMEWRYTRTGTNTYTIGYRIYNIAGTLLYDTEDMDDDWWATGSNTLDAQTFTVTGAGASSMTGFQIGIESSQGSGAYCEYAAVAISAGASADWIGAYTAAEGTWEPS